MEDKVMSTIKWVIFLKSEDLQLCINQPQ